MSLEQSVRAALAARPAAEIEPRDAAAADLALHYARELDAGADPAKLGPALLAALESLRMTPKARATGKGSTGDTKPARSTLDELRDRRARKDAAAAVDAATS